MGRKGQRQQSGYSPAGQGKPAPDTERRQLASISPRQERLNAEMDKRLSLLDQRVEQIQSTLRDVQAEVRDIGKDVGILHQNMATVKATMAGKGFIVSVVLAALLVISAVTVFQEELRSWAGPEIPGVTLSSE